MAEPIVTASDERGWFSKAPGMTMLWAGILAGPTAWALDLLISYAIVKWACGHQTRFVLHLVTLGALAMTAAGAAASWVALQRTPEQARDEGARPFDRGRFMALLGLLISAMFGLAMIANDLPRWMLDACL
jgi:hypothetical protein